MRNTEGRSGPRGLEESTSDEVLRELCDKNYHQLLPLIAEKMQKEKEQQDKPNAVKARLLYDDESGRNPRNREESHYSESKTSTARTEPRRKHGSRRRRAVYSIGWGKEQSASARFDSRHSSLAKGTEVQPRKRHHRGISPEETAYIRRVKTAREVTGNPNQRGTSQTPTKMISLSLGRVRKETLSHLEFGISISQGQGCLAMSRHTTEAGIRKTTQSYSSLLQKQRGGQCQRGAICSAQRSLEMLGSGSTSSQKNPLTSMKI
ncbi:hypothetical protein Tco_0932085 [Tanacetum coccineum]